MHRSRTARIILLLTALTVCQFVLYGSSLLGRTYLLPLGLLAGSNYLPRTAEYEGVAPEHLGASDLVLAIEFRQRYAAEQVRQGRIPLWNPYNYCGAPFLAANNTAVFSPFSLPRYLFPSPVTIAWVQLLRALVIGCGAYAFFRIAMRVDFAPALVGAVCYPLTWFFIQWRGYPPSDVVAWLPWLLLATDRAIRHPLSFAPPLLALLTAVVLLSGQAASAAHVLLASGLYALWCLLDHFGWRKLLSWGVATSAAVTTVAWLLGFILSAPQNLPTVEYLRMSHRIDQRLEGSESRTAVGPAALPQLLLPNCYGSMRRGSAYIPPGGEWRGEVYVSDGNPAEGAPSGYAGLFVLACLAPLGWQSRAHRSLLLFCLVAAIVAAAYLFTIPGIETLYTLFPLNLLKNNRFMFLVSWAALVSAVVGLHVAYRSGVRWQAWHAAPMSVLAILAVWSASRALDLPEEVTAGLIEVWGDPEVVGRWFTWMYWCSAAVCVVALLLWATIALGWLRGRRMFYVASALAVCELLVMAYGLAPQRSPKLYYPPIETLEELADSRPGRICGVMCLPPNLNQRFHLSDIRGYDGVDPRYLVQLLESCEQQVPGRPSIKPRYAVTQYFDPLPSPVLDMLNLRYRIHRGEPPVHRRAFLAGDDYWVEESQTCLPRAFVPRRVETIADSAERLVRLANRSFDPTDVAFVESPVELPGAIRGYAKLLETDDPQRLEIELEMQTAGLVVVSDLWFPGWEATVDGQPAEVLRTNHAVRSVAVPAGAKRLEMRYKPHSFALGLQLAAAGGALWIAWLMAAGSASSRERRRPIDATTAISTT